MMTLIFVVAISVVSFSNYQSAVYELPVVPHCHELVQHATCEQAATQLTLRTRITVSHLKLFSMQGLDC